MLPAEEDGEQAVALFEANRPHMAILDIAMPGLNGLEAAEAIRTQDADLPVMSLTGHSAAAYMQSAVRLRLMDYLSTYVPRKSGEAYYSPVRFDEVTGEPSMTISIILFLANPFVAESANGASAKYIFYFIGDGMANVQIHSAEAYPASI